MLCNILVGTIPGTFSSEYILMNGSRAGPVALIYLSRFYMVVNTTHIFI